MGRQLGEGETATRSIKGKNVRQQRACLLEFFKDKIGLTFPLITLA